MGAISYGASGASSRFQHDDTNNEGDIMQAVMYLKLKPIQAVQIRETAKKPAGRFAKLNGAISKFVTFQSDEKLLEMDSPYRWMQ